MKPYEPSIHQILLDLLNLEVSMDDSPECQMRQNSLDWDFTIVLSNSFNLKLLFLLLYLIRKFITYSTIT